MILRHIGEGSEAIRTMTGQKQITGDVAFFLYGTLGFPIDLTQVRIDSGDEA